MADRLRSKVGSGHAEAILDPPQLVVSADHKTARWSVDIGGVRFPSGQCSDFGFQASVHARFLVFEGDEPVAFDRDLALNSLLGLGDLLVESPRGFVPLPFDESPRVCWRLG